jgi:CRP/FNR family transcriptional regulator, cyclic AMP receptor protein
MMMQAEARRPGQEIHAALAAFALFRDLDPDTRAGLAAIGRPAAWAEGATLFQRGDEGDHMIALTGGRIRLSIGTAQGRELVIAHLARGDVLGELALIDGLPRSADAVAVAPTTGIVIARAGFLRLARDKADLGLALARHLSELLRNTNYQMESIALFDLRLRVIRFFLFALRQIHGDDLPDRPVIQMPLNQSDLSALLGASRPKVNRVLQDLIAAGALERDAGRIICDVARLRHLAASDGADDIA